MAFMRLGTYLFALFLTLGAANAHAGDLQKPAGMTAAPAQSQPAPSSSEPAATQAAPVSPAPAAPAAKQASTPPHHTAARLVSAVTGTGDKAILPVALGMRIEKGWKTYWRTPGEAGLAPTFDWTGSVNFRGATVRWPPPRRYTAEGLDNYVYENSVIFPFDIAPADPGKPVSLKLKLDILVCNQICLPETWSLSLDIPAGPAGNNAATAEYNKVLSRIPSHINSIFSRAYLNFDSSNSTYLVVEANAAVAPASDADLFVEHGSGLGFGKPSVAYDAERHLAVFTAPVHSPAPIDKIAAQLSGSPITMTWTNRGDAVEGSLSLTPRPAAQPPVSQQGHRARTAAVMTLTGLQVALFALLGGLILNLMPCVLPVLSLKILSVLGHGGKDSKKAIFSAFTASALGILASFWMMAATLAALKAAGREIGWGIQFQNPVFLSFLIAVVLAFAANMWGLFEIPLPRFIARNIPAKHEHQPTLLGHFLTGAFATLLATPCTAPFLGTAVGFALSGSTLDIFAIFTLIGLGLASPYIALAVSPGLFRFLPKPGKWMVTLKKALALALVLTAAWLISVLMTITTTPALDEGWQPFEEVLIAPAVKDGKVVVVDVTADWCLTCKANKRLVLDTEEIVDALSGPEILRLQADWTQRDPKIADYLRKYGRYGIPFNIVYGPAAPDGIALPELLTKKAVLGAIAEAAGE
jgi:suppressor for copper-sensitivity B